MTQRIGTLSAPWFGPRTGFRGLVLHSLCWW